MAKTRFIQNSFTSGVLSPLLKGRTELQQYYNSLEVGDNVVLLPQGGLKRRPGTKYIDTALPILTRNTTTPTMPEGGTAANINDDNDSTSTTTTNNVSTTDPYVVAHYDLTSSTYIETVDVRGILLTVSGTSTEFVVQSSADDSTWTTRATVPTIGTTATDSRLKVAATDRYWRLARVGSTDLTTNKVTLEDFMLYEKSVTPSLVELKDFSVTSARQYLLAFTDKHLRIYKNGLQVADMKMPYESADVNALRVTQTESVMIVCHEDYPPRRIINLQTDADWSTDEVPFTNVPQYDYNDDSSPTPTDDVQVLTFTGFVAGDTFQIDIEGVLSKEITYAGDTTVDEQSATAFNIQKNIQDMPVVGETGVSCARTGAAAYTVTISGESTKAFELFTAFATSGTASKTVAVTHTTTGVARKEDVWSATRGYPRNVAFYEGRLFFGGTKSKTQSVFASKSGSAFDFDIGEGFDDDAIFATIATRKLNEITDIFPARRMQIFTSGSEFVVNSVPMTPTSFTIAPQTSHGASDVEAQEIDGATLFIDRNGRTIREYVFSFNEDAYIANDISVLSPELISNPVDMAILGGTSSDDANWVFIVNDDGSATVLNTLRAQDINGFTKWSTSGEIKNVAVVDDQLFMANKRTINGSVVYFIEQWSFDYYMDAATIQTYGSPTTAISNLDHLEGETVGINADNYVVADKTVSSGAITLPNGASAVQVGLKYTASFKPMPVNTNVGSGQNQMRIKKIVRMNVRVNQTAGMTVDGLELPVRAFGDSTVSPLDSAPTQTTGIIEDVHLTTGWTRDTMPLFEQSDPLPMSVLAIDYEVESS